MKDDPKKTAAFVTTKRIVTRPDGDGLKNTLLGRKNNEGRPKKTAAFVTAK
jgi:hypothetical protein